MLGISVAEDMKTSRRQLLRTGSVLTLGTGFGGVASARALDDAPGLTGHAVDRDGQTGVLSSGGTRQIPACADWVPDPAETGESAPVQAVYSAATSAVLEAPTGTGTPGANETGAPSDPILVNPAVAGATVTFAWLELDDVGLADPVLGPAAGNGSADPAEVPTDRTLVVGAETQVYLGSFGDGVADAVDDGPYTEVDGGTYVHEDVGTAVTWTDGAVVVGPDVDRVETVAGAGTGEVPRHHDTTADYGWLLDTAGQGGLTVAAYSFEGPFPEGGDADDSGEDYSMFAGATGFAQSATLAGGEFASATTGVAYESADAVRRDRLASALGTDAADRTVEQSENRITLRATYAVSGETETPTATTAAGDGTATATDAPTGTATETDSEGPDGATATTSGSGPGFGALAAVASLVGAGYLAGRSGGDRR